MGIASLFIVSATSSCKKSGGATSGATATVTFTVKGQNININAAVDTTNGFGLELIGRGIMPGSHDSAWLEMDFYPSYFTWPSRIPTGTYGSDPNLIGYFNYTDSASNITYSSQEVMTKWATMTVTDTSNRMLKGTFQGMVGIDNNGTVFDSTMIINGRFSVKLNP